MRWSQKDLERTRKKTCLSKQVLKQKVLESDILKAVKLVLPYPISANKYWRSFKHSRTGKVVHTLSREAKSYKTEVGWLAKKAGFHKPTEKPIELKVLLIPKNKIVMDLSNCLKVTEDALQGIVYENDKQVKRIFMEYGQPDGNGALIVCISEIDF